MGRVVYTVLTGGYEPLLEQHVAARFDTDLVCFTDDAGLSSRTWQIRPLEPCLPLDPGRSSRRPKILAHEYLHEYDESIYVDNAVLLTVDPARLFDVLLPDGVAMAALAHSIRGPLREEFDAVVRYGREAAWVCDEQLAHYAAEDPAALDEQTLWGGLLVRRHHDAGVRRAMVVWWEHVLRYSRRDQLSLPFALRATGLHVAVHTLDNSLSELHEWPRGGVVHTRARPALPPGPEVIIAGLEDRVTQLEAREAELEARAERVEVRAAELETLGAVALVERDALAARVESVEASLSWRLMRPARTAKRAARRLQGALADVARPASADDGG